MNKPKTQVLNPTILEGFIGSDPELIQEFKVKFLQQAVAEVKLIATFYNQQNWEEVKGHAHFLKTSAKATGAEQCAELLEKIEQAALDNDAPECKILIIALKHAIMNLQEVIKQHD